MLQMRTSPTRWRSYRRNRTPWVCLRIGLHDYLTPLDKPDMTDSFTAAKCSLCLWVFIFLFSYAARKRNRPLWLRPARKSPWYQSARAGQCQCVGVCVGMCLRVYVGRCYTVPSWSNPSTCSLHADVMLAVPTFLWTTLHVSSDISLNGCSWKRLCPRVILNTTFNCFQRVLYTLEKWNWLVKYALKYQHAYLNSAWF